MGCSDDGGSCGGDKEMFILMNVSQGVSFEQGLDDVIVLRGDGTYMHLVRSELFGCWVLVIAHERSEAALFYGATDQPQSLVESISGHFDFRALSSAGVFHGLDLPHASIPQHAHD